MSASRVIRSGVRLAMALAILVLTAVAVPSIGGATVASAQTETVCPGGVAVAIGQTCPSDYTVCPGGVTAAANQACGSNSASVTSGSTLTPGANLFTCPDGTVITQSQSCPLTPNSNSGLSTCPDGSVIAIGQLCATSTTSLFTCPDGSTIFLGTGAACPTYTTCANGTAVALGVTCSTGTTSFVCSNGTVVSSSSLCPTTGQIVTVPLPAGQWVPIQNTGSTIATVTGADAVLVYNPASGSYFPSMELAPGQSGVALSYSGGFATITYAAS